MRPLRIRLREQRALPGNQNCPRLVGASRFLEPALPQNEAHVGAGAIGDAHALADGIVHQRVKPMVHREVAVEIDSPEQSQQAPWR